MSGSKKFGQSPLFVLMTFHWWISCVIPMMMQGVLACQVKSSPTICVARYHRGKSVDTIGVELECGELNGVSIIINVRPLILAGDNKQRSTTGCHKPRNCTTDQTSHCSFCNAVNYEKPWKTSIIGKLTQFSRTFPVLSESYIGGTPTINTNLIQDLGSPTIHFPCPLITSSWPCMSNWQLALSDVKKLPKI